VGSEVSSRHPSLAGPVLVALLFLAPPPAEAQHNLLEPYEDGSRVFTEVEIGEDLVVYYHQRTIQDAAVEKDFIVYQFDRHSSHLLARKSHWRDDLPEAFPFDLISRDEAIARVQGDIQWTRLLVISPESDVYPIEPEPENPCWVVTSLEGEALVVTVVDATSGRILGNGIPPPYGGFSFSGPHYIEPCRGAWTEWYQNATDWYGTMGYYTDSVEWPTLEHIQSHVQSTTTSVVYIIAHGNPLGFWSGCAGGETWSTLYASDVEAWITDYTKVCFAFLGGCDALCETGPGTISHAFRKGSMDSTITVGYCAMSEGGCMDAWIHSVDWQDALFGYLQSGLTMQEAFDQAGADYPMCVVTGCMEYCGDPDFVISPPVPRSGNMAVVDPFGTGDYPTIQAAIDSLPDEAYIALTEGTFTGSGNRDIDFRGKSIILRSLTGDAEECVLDCEGLGRAFSFDRGQGGSPIVYGMTLTGGTAFGSPPEDCGGAVCCRGASPTFSSCTFIGNEAVGDGGAVYCDSASLTLVGCLLESNMSGGAGGAVAVGEQSQAAVVMSTVRSNVAFDRGGGIAAGSPLSLSLYACTIAGNSATSRAPFARGGGVFLDAGATVEGCTIVGNRSTAEGGGICAASDEPLEVEFRGCTIAGNCAETAGGGVYCGDGAELRFEETILWGNGAAAGPNICTEGDGRVELACCDVDSTGIDGTAEWLWSNTSFPPGFCDPRDYQLSPTAEGDYHIKDVSPCAAGCSLPPCGQIGALGPGCGREVLTVLPDGAGPYETIQAAIDSAASYDIIELGPGTFTGPGNRDLDLRGKACVLRPQGGTPTETVIDCENQGRAFRFHSAETCSTQVENISVTNGYAVDGGAIYCERSAPRIVGCILDGNAGDASGGALYTTAASPSLKNCTLIRNSAAIGAGIRAEDSSPTLTGTIVAFGVSGEAISCDSVSAPLLACSNLYGNAGGDWVGCIAGQENANGNLSADPQFCDLAGDNLNLFSDSPCADAPGCGRVGATGVACYRKRVWEVPGDTPTIASAMDSAAAGDTVLVHCGTYPESGLVLKSGVRILSETGTPDCVTIDARGESRVMTCIGTDSTTVVRGISLTGGVAEGMWPDNAGGAVYCEGASPTFERCCFRQNAAAYGGAVAANSSTPIFRQCTFVANTGSSLGGALYSYYYGSSVSLEGCIVAGSTQGEAVHCAYQGTATLSCTDIYDNAGGDWVGCISDQQGADGNQCCDPLFCDPDSGDFHLDSASPCAPDHAPPGCMLVGAVGVGCEVTSVVERAAGIPTALYLGPAVPNPFNPTTEISFGIPAAGESGGVSLGIYDALGRRVVTLVDAELSPGYHCAAWDGTDGNGVRVASGVYFYRIEWSGRSETRKMVLLK